MKPLTKIRTVHQLVPSIAKQDGVGNEVILMQESLRSLGMDSKIYHVSGGLDGVSKSIYDVGDEVDSKKDVFLYHFAVGSKAKDFLKQRNQRFWIRYHNITPSCFFENIQDEASTVATKYGLSQLPYLAMDAECVISVSKYNILSIQDWVDEGTDVEVLPILRKYDSLKSVDNPFDRDTIEKVNGKKTILFVGRICPNKAQQDLIEFLYLYRKIYRDSDVRLVLVGSFYSQGFAETIKKYVKDLGLVFSEDIKDFEKVDVLFRARASDAELGFWYRYSRLFLSVSEHEGFCIPLVEAMSFSLPILAHPVAAVTETLGDAGWLVDKKNKKEFLQTMHLFLNTEESWENSKSLRKNAVIKRLHDLSYESVNTAFFKIIKKYF